MPAVGAGAGATYAASGGGAGAAIGGAGAAIGAGGWLWLHATTSANVDAIMIGLANLTITLSLGGAPHLSEDSSVLDQLKRGDHERC